MLFRAAPIALEARSRLLGSRPALSRCQSYTRLSAKQFGGYITGQDGGEPIGGEEEFMRAVLSPEGAGGVSDRRRIGVAVLARAARRRSLASSLCRAWVLAPVGAQRRIGGGASA
jgi:hypothetical protein